jgi:hypothetical protein
MWWASSAPPPAHPDMTADMRGEVFMVAHRADEEKSVRVRMPWAQLAVMLRSGCGGAAVATRGPATTLYSLTTSRHA